MSNINPTTASADSKGKSEALNRAYAKLKVPRANTLRSATLPEPEITESTSGALDPIDVSFDTGASVVITYPEIRRFDSIILSCFTSSGSPEDWDSELIDVTANDKPVETNIPYNIIMRFLNNDVRIMYTLRRANADIEESNELVLRVARAKPVAIFETFASLAAGSITSPYLPPPPSNYPKARLYSLEWETGAATVADTTTPGPLMTKTITFAGNNEVTIKLTHPSTFGVFGCTPPAAVITATLSTDSGVSITAPARQTGNDWAIIMDEKLTAFDTITIKGGSIKIANLRFII